MGKDLFNFVVNIFNVNFLDLKKKAFLLLRFSGISFHIFFFFFF